MAGHVGIIRENEIAIDKNYSRVVTSKVHAKSTWLITRKWSGQNAEILYGHFPQKLVYTLGYCWVWGMTIQRKGATATVGSVVAGLALRLKTG